MSAARDYLLLEALAAADRGWSLTPLRGKAPRLRGWQRKPAASAEEIRAWVAQGYNLGLRTGPESGILVVDVDPGRDDGTPLPHMPQTVTVATGGGGSHYYFVCPEAPPSNSSSRVHPAIDIKSAGGQVVFPGSVHPETGRTYEWAAELSPTEVGVAHLPAALIEAMQEPRKPAPQPRPMPQGLSIDERQQTSRARAWLARVPGAVSGQRGHDRTFYVACSLVLGFDLAPETALAVMTEWNETCCPPWSERELRHKVDDANKKPNLRGYMLSSPSHEAPTWVTAALGAAPVDHIVLPRRVSRRTVHLLNTGSDSRYELPCGDLDGSRAVFAAAMSMLGAGLSDCDVACALAASALRPAIDAQAESAAAWLAATIQAAQRALAMRRGEASQ